MVTYDFLRDLGCQLEVMDDRKNTILRLALDKSDELMTQELIGMNSSFFKIELGNIERDLGIIQNVRGNGTFIGFDTADARSANLI